MTVKNPTSVPMSSAYVSFFWKMKQFVLLDLDAVTSSRVKSTYAIKKNSGSLYKIALWTSVTTDQDGVQTKWLNAGVADSIPNGHTSERVFAFSNDACGFWLEKGNTTGEDFLVIGTGDIRNINTNPAGFFHRIRISNAEASATVITCSMDFEINIYSGAGAAEAATAISTSTVQN